MKKPTHIQEAGKLVKPQILNDAMSTQQATESKDKFELQPEFVETYNAITEQQGLPLEEWRQF